MSNILETADSVICSRNGKNQGCRTESINDIAADFGGDNRHTSLGNYYEATNALRASAAHETGITEPHGSACFAAGTIIATKTGAHAIETLRPGDRILTMDNGYQPIRWIGPLHLSTQKLTQTPGLRPIRIASGALGEGSPNPDLLISPQHRVWIRSETAQQMFGEREVLIRAQYLLPLDGIEIAEDLPEVTYWHFLFDAHQIVFSNGAPSESLFSGPEALRSVVPKAQEDILQAIPDLARGTSRISVRPFVPTQHARSFAARIAKSRGCKWPFENSPGHPAAGLPNTAISGNGAQEEPRKQALLPPPGFGNSDRILQRDRF